MISRSLFSLVAALAVSTAVLSVGVMAQAPPRNSVEGLQMVLSEGVGGSALEAIQNAAQNALTQVVGSFMDADTIMKKRIEIQNGIRSETKEIQKDVREYSQGFIQHIETLATRQDGSLWRVTAKVFVRSGEFRAYTLKLAEGEASLDNGLFAEVKIAVNQSNSLRDLLVKPLQQIADGTVQEFVVGKVIPYQRSKYYRDESIRKYIGDYLEKGGRTDSLIVIPITTKLKKEFVENFRAVIKNTAVTRRTFFNCSLLNCLRDIPGTYTVDISLDPDFLLFDAEWDGNVAKGILYKFAIPRSQVFRSLALPIGNHTDAVFLKYKETKRKSLVLALRAATGEPLPFKFSAVIPPEYYGFSEDIWGDIWFLLTLHNYDLGIVLERNFSIILDVEPETLAKASSISLTIE